MADGPTTEADVIAAIGDFQDPETGRGIVTMEQLREIKIDGSQLSLTLALTTFTAPLWQETRELLADQLKNKLPGFEKIEVNLAEHDRPAEKTRPGRPNSQGRYCSRLGQGGRREKHDRHQPGNRLTACWL